MKLIEVTDKNTSKAFLQVPKILYRGDANYVCPLDREINDVFNPLENRLFNNGAAIRWVLKDDAGKLIGRVAAFYNLQKSAQNEQPTGGLGFFECINDQQAANMLFDACKSWLKSKGMEAMDGPITFGENLTFWGLLVDGYTLPAYGMPYNYPYYRNLFETYGFKTYFEQFSYETDLAKPFPERQVKFTMHIKDKFQTEHFSFQNKEKYLQDICTIYNKVWEDFHEDYTPLEYDEIEKMMKKARVILNEEFIWFVYDQGKPVALVIVFPDVNQILKKMGNGKLTLWNILKFFYYKNTGTITRARQLLTAVTPEYQRSGVTGVLFLTMVDALKRNKIKTLDMSWVGDYNTTVNKIYRLLGIPVVKTHITFRIMFDPTKEVNRFTNVHTEKHKRLAGDEPAA
ncbi:MAG: GNAT family N-acetyltransferase [Bacteroidetes bacterium]|nr:GNAT family N-acetyltransferase [Bacteroidota bacterium]